MLPFVIETLSILPLLFEDSQLSTLWRLVAAENASPQNKSTFENALYLTDQHTHTPTRTRPNTSKPLPSAPTT